MLIRVLAVAAAATALVPSTLWAETIFQSQGPAELPPASYKGGQFVDSSGCIFMRAGYGGNTTWVPRVTRSRQLMCGYKPTFAQNETRPATHQSITTEVPLNKPKVAAAAPAPAPAPIPAPSKAAAPMPTIASKMAPAPAAATYTAKTTPKYSSGTPVGAVGPVTAHQVALGDAPSEQQTKGSGSAVEARPVKLVNKASCPGYSYEVSKVYTLSDGRTAVSCQPGSNTYMVVRVVDQAQAKQPVQTAQLDDFDMKGNVPVAPPQPLLPAGSPAPAQSTTAAAPLPASVAPASVAQIPASSGQTVYADRTSGVNGASMVDNPNINTAPVVPSGYKQAWTDGRLNPLRGPRSAAGDQSMNLVWTDTVPRQLLNTTTGQNVTSKYPGLTYPDTVRARPVSTTAKVARSHPVRTASAQRTTRATLSTSNAAVAAAPSPQAGGRYVQVGAFGEPGNATRTAARLRAAGLPVAMGTMHARGRVLKTVMAGPFASTASLTAALGTVRQAGFGDAYIR
ncbi:SPOR domain-containing protein [Acidimangrovimonas sediminis]|uniref:SPOR domain-containing protein n=1 Tax=Acidimangrovimonas sediminis TaxID=2056283 RepID=UPI000C80223D|nr:SPOR domain-containing protein [Acidimangrovimonas sediminis]